MDCSLLAALLFDEPRREAAALALAGKELYAPYLIDDEMVSVALKKTTASLEEVVRPGLEDLTRLRLTRCQTDVTARYQLAGTHGLTDAAYLQLAIELAAPLATFDAVLGQIAMQVLGGLDPQR